MKPVKLKVGLFGFRRKQVLSYLDDMTAEFTHQAEQQQAEYTAAMQQLQTEMEEKLRVQENALMTQLQENTRLEQQWKDTTQSLENTAAALKTSQDEKQMLADQLQEKQTAFEATNCQYRQAMEQLEQLQQQLSAKDSLIADQTMEVAHLQDVVTRLEEEFVVLREDAQQTSAMAEYLNVLQARNSSLVRRIAQLEAQLEDRDGSERIQGYTDAAQKRQASVETVENLFAGVFREIQEALENLSQKIQEQSLTQTGGQVLDMANL